MKMFSSDSFSSKLFYNLVSCGIAFISIRVILDNGTRLVDRPRLVSSNVWYMLPKDDKKKGETSFVDVNKVK